jgi:hypothetical protein
LTHTAAESGYTYSDTRAQRYQACARTAAGSASRSLLLRHRQQRRGQYDRRYGAEKHSQFPKHSLSSLFSRAAAHALMETSAHIGKIVLTI